MPDWSALCVSALLCPFLVCAATLNNWCRQVWIISGVNKMWFWINGELNKRWLWINGGLNKRWLWIIGGLNKWWVWIIGGTIFGGGGSTIRRYSSSYPPLPPPKFETEGGGDNYHVHDIPENHSKNFRLRRAKSAYLPLYKDLEPQKNSPAAGKTYTFPLA